MTPERFKGLAEAFGGDVARWPEAHREAAAARMAMDPVETARTLEDARRLDTILSASPSPNSTPGLVERILKDAPAPRRARWINWLTPVGLGAGLAAACAAGVLVGAQLWGPLADSDPMLTVVADDAASLYLGEAA